jgi:hypothetical protein
MPTEPTRDSEVNRRTIDRLNQFLRHELAAAATYERALRHLHEPLTREVLTKNRHSHATRAVMLAQEVEREGGRAARKAGAWGTLATIVEESAALLGTRAVLKVLREGEAAGLDSYLGGVNKLAPAAAEAVRRDALPEQQLCLRRIEERVGANPS